MALLDIRLRCRLMGKILAEVAVDLTPIEVVMWGRAFINRAGFLLFELREECLGFEIMSLWFVEFLSVEMHYRLGASRGTVLLKLVAGDLVFVKGSSVGEVNEFVGFRHHADHRGLGVIKVVTFADMGRLELLILRLVQEGRGSMIRTTAVKVRVWWTHVEGMVISCRVVV